MRILSSTLTLFAVILFASFISPGYNVGDYATDFKLKNIDGKMISLTDYPDAKGFVVIFTCNHCPYAKLYEDRIVSLDKSLKKKGYPVIAINPNDPVSYPEDSYANMQARAKDKKFTFPYLLDETQEVAKAFGATRTPHVFVLQKEADGKFKVAYIGAIDDDTEGTNKNSAKHVENAVNALEKGEKPNPDFTKAVGCGIKWKS